MRICHQQTYCKRMAKGSFPNTKVTIKEETFENQRGGGEDTIDKNVDKYFSSPLEFYLTVKTVIMSYMILRTCKENA